MFEREIKNAKITRTKLGFDRGVFLCAWLYLDYGGGQQGFGGYVLAKKNEIKPHIGAAYIVKILDVVGVEKWEDLPGKHIRVDAEHATVHGIGNIIKDDWFYPNKFYEEHKQEEK